MTTPENPDPAVTGRFAEFLEELGASEELVAEALSSGMAERLAGDLVLARGADMTLSDLAHASGIDEAKVASIWRDLGAVQQLASHFIWPHLMFTFRDLPPSWLLSESTESVFRLFRRIDNLQSRTSTSIAMRARPAVTRAR